MDKLTKILVAAFLLVAQPQAGAQVKYGVTQDDMLQSSEASTQLMLIALGHVELCHSAIIMRGKMAITGPDQEQSCRAFLAAYNERNRKLRALNSAATSKSRAQYSRISSSVDRRHGITNESYKKIYSLRKMLLNNDRIRLCKLSTP